MHILWQVRIPLGTAHCGFQTEEGWAAGTAETTRIRTTSNPNETGRNRHAQEQEEARRSRNRPAQEQDDTTRGCNTGFCMCVCGSGGFNSCPHILAHTHTHTSHSRRRGKRRTRRRRTRRNAAFVLASPMPR